LEYLDIYVTDNADTVYSEYFDGSYYSEDAVRSECMDDYLKANDSDVIEIKTSASGDTDYCVKDYVQHYIKINGEYYSRENYIKDPYTDEYHFKDEIVDGEKYIKSLERKLEEDLEVKEKYTLPGEKFDLEKYRMDLKKLLVEYVPTDEFIEEVKKKGGDNSYYYHLPGLYAWIIRDQMNYGKIDANYQTSAALSSYKKLLFDILEEMPENFDKEDIKKWYDDKFSYSWNLRSVFKIFDNVDITKFPTEIYKRIFFINI
jgi:hypothetical protein